jgi:hypothetical protein
MWSDDQYDYVRLDGIVIMFKRVVEQEQELSTEEQIRMVVVESALWGSLFMAALFVVYVILAAI